MSEKLPLLAHPLKVDHVLLAFLPSSFAMYATTLAYAFVLDPASLNKTRKTLLATLLFATGAIVGWPFALALSLPFVFEELFVAGFDRVTPETRFSWSTKRWTRMATAVIAASLVFVSDIYACISASARC